MLKNKAILVGLTIKCWAGRIKDKEVTSKVDNMYDAKNAGLYTKRLVTSDNLSGITTLNSRLRDYFYQKSLPWGNNGARIMLSSVFIEFMKAVSQYNSNLDREIDKLIAAYPDIMASAQERLGDLYNPDEYPKISELSELFGASVDATPIADDDDFRLDINPDELEEVKELYRATIQQNAVNAQTHVLTLVSQELEKIKSKLADPDTRITVNLFNSLRSMVESYSKMAIFDPDIMSAKLNDISFNLFDVDIHSLRMSEDYRNEVIADIDAHLDALNG
jgi:hypothetical protein